MESDRLATLLLQMSIFGIIFALWAAGITFWVLQRSKQKKQLERRLQFDQQGGQDDRVIRLWHDGKAVDAVVPDTQRLNWAEKLERARQDAGWKTPMPRVLALNATILAGLCALTWVMSGRMIMALASVAVYAMFFRTCLMRCISRRQATFEKQLVEALDLGARSLRAGHPLSGAFKLISQEIGVPVSTLFTEIIEQEQLGVSLQKALLNASAKSRSPDMKIFATSVAIQLRSGGNLADMIDRVAWVVRERMRLNRRARVLTAEAQLSKWVLLALPLGMFVLLNLINPQYMEPFFTSYYGSVMMGVAVGMLSMGAWVMNRMARLKY
jgi:tight adherence protein B